MGKRMKRVLFVGMVLAGTSLFADDFTTSDATNGDVSPYTTTPWSLNNRFQIKGVSVTGENSTSINTSGLSPVAYLDDFSSTGAEEVVDCYKGAGYSFDITLRDNVNGSGWIDGQVWVDWNRDGDWDDAGEALGLIGNGSRLNQQEKTLVKLVNIPSDAVTGKTRMRIRVADGGGSDDSNMTPDSNSPVGYGYAQDYTVNVVMPAIATPVLSKVVTDSGINLSWTQAGSVDNFTIEVAEDVGFTRFVNGYPKTTADGSVLSENIIGLTSGTTYYARIKANSGASSSPYAVDSARIYQNKVSNDGVDYYNYTWGTNRFQITRVQTLNAETNFDNADPDNSKYFIDHAGDVTPAEVEVDSNFDLNITLKDTTNNYGWSAGKVWVDWNADGDWDDTDEEVALMSAGQNSSDGEETYSFSVTVPNGTALGNKRMRIRINDNQTAIDPYGAINRSGTAQDYLIAVIEEVTPAIGLEIKQVGTELTWTIEDEIDVKEYRVVNVENKEILEVVLADRANSYSVTVPEGYKVELVVVDNSGFSKSYAPEDGTNVTEVYDLEEGWNLIAVTSDDAELETLRDETAGVIWGWNGIGYEVIETAEATDAVWVYVPIAKQVYVSGIKSDARITLTAGWNMVGPVENDYIPAGANTVYSWSKVYDIIADESKVLIGGKGYWIFSL